MKTINLLNYYPELYEHDCLVEVTDDVAKILEDDKRCQKNYAQYIRDNKAFYSLDCDDGIETAAINKAEQPDEAHEHAEFLNQFNKLLKKLPPIQAQRVYKSIILGKSKSQIAKDENVSEGAVRKSIQQGLSFIKSLINKF